MQCNIDARGKRLRLVMALITLVVAVAVALAAALGALPGLWPWAAAVLLAVVGSFVLFEARAGWCALRALGIKTPV